MSLFFTEMRKFDFETGPNTEKLEEEDGDAEKRLRFLKKRFINAVKMTFPITVC